MQASCPFAAGRATAALRRDPLQCASRPARPALAPLRLARGPRHPQRHHIDRCDRRLGPAGAGQDGGGKGKPDTRQQKDEITGIAFDAPIPGRIVDGPMQEGPDEVEVLVLWLRRVPWKRLLTWVFVVCAALQFKDFFGIAMGTFVIGFIGQTLVSWTQKRLVPPTLRHVFTRHALVACYFLAIFGALAAFGLVTIPNIVSEGTDFVARLQSDNIWTVILEKMRAGLGDGIMDKVESFILMATSDDLTHLPDSVKAILEGGMSPERSTLVSSALQSLVRDYTEAAVAITSSLLAATTKIAAQVVISLILSFIVLWDLPNIREGIQSLENSRLKQVYNELAPPLMLFGQLFGKALQAQARIALANTLLTGLGMWILQIPGVGLLSMIVFICGFIPIAGVFLSTAPIGFVALTEYGFIKLTLTIMMIVGVHFMEAYVLNPAIYSAHLQLHPLLVLSVLVIAEHSLGFWGLLLAVPMTVFALDYCIRYPDLRVTEIAARELSNVERGNEENLEPHPILP
ncbi:unnamed protein product [Pedinophyceae sp. YPF-701]|nr:unnamed protein product [Pedinophyceae sp. YPF-701]